MCGIEYMQANGLFKWLSDDRNNGPLPENVMMWFFSDWRDRAVAAGWKFWANIVPQDVIAAGSLIPVIHDLAEHGVKMNVYASMERDRDWLYVMGTRG